MTEKDIKVVELVLNADQARQKLNELNRQFDTAAKKKQEAFERGDAKGIKFYSREMKRIQHEIAQVETRAKTVTRVLGDMDRARPEQLKKTIRELTRELDSGRVERGTKQWKTMTEAISNARTQLAGINEEMAAQRGLLDSLSEWGNKWLGVTEVVDNFVGMYSGLRSWMQQQVTAYAQLEEHMAGVVKYTGMTREEVSGLNEELKRMDTRTSLEGLNDLAADAGRLGITARKDVMDFVEAANMINTALGQDLGEGAVRNIGKLAELFGDSERMGLKQAMLATGSVINDLAQSSSANEGYIMDFTGRLAGMAKQAGMTQAEVMGLAAVLDQAMVNSEEGSTALSKIIQKLYREPAKLVQAVGMDVKQFSETMKRNANEGLLQFAQAAERLGGLEQLAPVLGDLDLTGAGVTKTLSALANNLEKVKATQVQAMRAFAEGTSVVNEYNVANNTVQAQLEKAQNGFARLSAELGERLMPAMTGLVSTSGTLIKLALALLDFFARWGRTAVTLTASLVAMTVAVKAHTLWTTACEVATKAAAAAQSLWNKALRKNPLTLFVSLAAAAVAWVWDYVEATDEAARAEQRRVTAANALLRAQERADNQAASELATIQRLVTVVNSNAHSYDAKRRAIERLNQIVPGLNKNTKEGIALTQKEISLINDHVKAIKNKALAQAYQEEFTELSKQILKAQRLVAGNEFDVHAVETELEKPQYRPQMFRGRDWNRARYKKVQELNAQKEALRAAQEELKGYQKQLQQIERELSSNKQLKSFFDALYVDVSPQGGSPTPTGGTTSGSAGTGKTNAKADDLVKKAREAIESEMKLAAEQMKQAYETGLSTAHMMEHGLLQIEVEKYERLSQVQGNSEAQRLEDLNKAMAARRELHKLAAAWSLSQIETEQQEEERELLKQYAQGELQERTYQDRLTDIRLRGLLRRAEYLKQYGSPQEADEAQAAYDKATADAQIARIKELEARAEQIRTEYLKKSKEERMSDEIKYLDELYKRGILSEEERQKALKAIREKYADGAAAQTDPLSSSLTGAMLALRRLQEELNNGQASWQTWAQAGLASFSVVTAGMQSMQQLHQANQQLEINETNRQYDEQIQRVGANTKRGKKLEEQKQKEVAKIRTKYAKKQAVMQIAQAVSDTAANAIKAYQAMAGIPVVGPALGAAAAAAAVAFGGIQIAAIKKQAAVQEQGYYRGGFTGGRDYRRAAGVVHEGEFVATHEAVNNPALAPVFSLLDQAQRRGSVASLTSEDVSRTILAPTLTAVNTARPQPAPAAALAPAPALPADSATVADPTLRALTRLSDQLDRGIEAYVTLDGPNGLDRQWRKYQRLNGRK